ncbi:MAG: AI-2E family transporter [Treponema sp.]|jgi:predicted PurR-regulated permease PerM|nr:AI-2E family transporter [Treponema sp.]
MRESDSLPSRRVQSYVFAAILVLLFLLVCRIFAPFFTALLWATLLYILLSPLHKRTIRRLDFNTRRGKALKNIWAAVFTLGATMIVLLPLSFTAAVFFRQIMELARYVREAVGGKPEIIQGLFERMADFLGKMSAGHVLINADDIQQRILAFLSARLERLVPLSGDIARNIGIFLFTMFLIVFSMFFFFVDGPYLSRLALRSIPIKKEYISTLTGKFMDITRNLFFGYIMVALIQTIMAYIIFSVFQINGSLVFAALTFICVFIPMFGGGMVWLPISISMFLAGNTAKGIIFVIVSGFFISTLDNLIRPLFLRDRIQLHPLIIFFAILGGIELFGFNGLVLGPIVVIFFLTVLDMFFIEHKLE